MSLETCEPAALPRSRVEDEAILDDLALFHRNLARMCRSGVPLPRALRTLEAEVGGRRLRRELTEMASEVEAGEPFAEAYAKRQKDFPEFYQALIRTGIETGDLVGVLDEIAAHAAMRATVVTRLRRVLAYPVLVSMFVIVIGVAVSLFAESYTSIVSVGFSGVNYVTPRSNAWIVTTLAMSALLLAVISAVSFVWLRNPVDASTCPLSIGFRVPFLGRLRSHATKAWFASSLAMLVRRQLPLPQALSFLCLSQKDRRLREQIQCMASSADDGLELHEALRKGNLIAPGLLWFVEASTSPESAAEALDDVARIYRQRLDRSLDRLCVFALPAFELCIGGAVLLFALSYVVPAVDISGSLAWMFGW